MARMIAKVTPPRDGRTQSAQRPQSQNYSLRSSFVAAAAALFLAPALHAHDLERTQVLLTFTRDGSFVLDVANDPSWLKLRLESFPGSFADRVVLWVDGHEVRPTSVEYLPPAGTDAAPVGRHRLRGRFPADAHTLRWYYGLVIDPYPLTVRRADGRVLVEEISGDAWSRTIDVSGQFQQPRVNGTVTGFAVAGLLLTPIFLRLVLNTKDTKDTKGKPCTS
jgi:hypothetical protein